MINSFTSTDICVITPTKDRPHKIVNLLKSLSEQTQKVGRIIVVGSGQNIESLVLNYKVLLPIEYYHSELSGQIRQRKLGVSRLDSRTKLVATLDDDIILEVDAIEKLIAFWNTKDIRTAGVGFNITNLKKHKSSLFLALFYSSSEHPGRVLKSGLVTQISNIEKDIQSDWLNGGATVWKQDIILEKIHAKNIDAKWAPCEDLIFSYPISQEFNLFVSSEAKVLHDDISLPQMSFSLNFYRGKVLAYWLFLFVSQNVKLSITAWLIALLANVVGAFFKNIIKLRYRNLGYSFGLFYGGISALVFFIFKVDIAEEIR